MNHLHRLQGEQSSNGYLDLVSGNERRILDFVRRGRDVTRAQLARATGLTAQSISRIVENLSHRGLLAVGDPIPSGRGQPSARVTLVGSSAYSVGISLMTDSVSAALMDLTGRTLGQKSVAVSEPDLAHVVRVIRELVDETTTEADVDTVGIVSMGVAIAGYFTGEGHQVNPPEPLHDFALVDVEEMLRNEFGIPVWVDNDGNAAAMGEALAGVGKQYGCFAYIYMAKGIGGSVVIDGQVFRGAFGNAGEFAGVLPVEAHDERPTLELLRTMIESEGTSVSSINELVDRFDPYWPGVENWIKVVRPHLQAIVSAISAVMDPEVIVLGGRIPEPLANRLIADIRFYNVPRRNVPRPVPKLVASKVSGDAAAIGAAATPLKAIFF